MLDLERAIEFHREALELPADDHLAGPASLDRLASCLVARFKQLGIPMELDEAVVLHRAALDLRPPGHADRPKSLSNLADAVLTRFRTSGVATDLEEAVALNQEARELQGAGDLERASSLNNLATALRVQFTQCGTAADLDEAISLSRSAMDILPPDHPDRPLCLNNLSASLYARFEHTHHETDLQEAVTAAQTALDLSFHNHSARALSLHSLANGVFARFQLAAAAELDDAIELDRTALAGGSQGSLDRIMHMNNLAKNLTARFKCRGEMKDLEEAINYSHAALELNSPDDLSRCATLNALADGLSARSKARGSESDMEDAMKLYQAASRGLEVSMSMDKLFSGDAFMSLKSPGNGGSEMSVTLDDVVSGKRDLSASLNSFVDSYVTQSTGKRPLSGLMGTSMSRRARAPLGQAPSRRRPSGGAFVPTVGAGPLKHGARRTPGQQLVAQKPEAQTPDLQRPDAQILSAQTLGVQRPDSQRPSTDADLDQAIELNQAALELLPPGHIDRSLSLDSLATALFAKFKRRHDVTVLGQAISHNREALDLRRPGHPDRPWSFDHLALALHARFDSQKEMPDLEEAIVFHRAALDLRPLGHLHRPISLEHLADSLEARFKQRGMVSDWEEAITLSQAAQAIPPPERPLHLLLQDFSILQTKGDPSEMKKIVLDVVFDALEAVPPRLIKTDTGKICDRNAQIASFEASTQCQELLSSLKTLRTLDQMKHIREAVSDYFRYVTLSHRWGKDEVLLSEVTQRSSIFDLPPNDGPKKLQKYCNAASEQKVLWAWSDTCCINKENNAELQEALGSMFQWYRQSALTIAYLLDVPNEPGALSRTIWLTRGWALQELLAPRIMLFYAQDWTLYQQKTSLNHKDKDSIVLKELERATGIPERCLTNFIPGTESARTRLQWASMRRTTLQEDIAYSLFGVFDVQLPIMYGERKDKAIGRLLQEIVARSGDTSVLDWVGEPSSFHSCFPASLSAFQIEPCPPSPISSREMELCVSRLAKLVTPEAANEFYNTLVDSHLPRASNGRLTMLCFVYPVQEVVLKRTLPNAKVYQVRAADLGPVRITSLDTLKEGSGVRLPYVLIRVWDRKLPEVLPKEDETAVAYKLMAQLVQPFSALLLRQLPHREFKRIASHYSIIVRVENAASIARSDLRTLDVL